MQVSKGNHSSTTMTVSLSLVSILATLFLLRPSPIEGFQSSPTFGLGSQSLTAGPSVRYTTSLFLSAPNGDNQDKEDVSDIVDTFVSSPSHATAPVSSVKKEPTYLDNTYYQDGTRPESGLSLAIQNFRRQFPGLVEQFVSDPLNMTVSKQAYLPPSERLPQCLGLTLDDDAVKEAERRRESRGGKVDTNPVSRALYDVGCYFLDELFPNRPIARFWFLETIARIPYFSYVSMLHLYESFGWWRAVELRKVHNAEEYNELHHLLITEALGGNALWSDRFLAYHTAIVYYWCVNALFLFSPRAAYEFMELLESHAVDTYMTFVNENKERLKQLPPPQVAKQYYSSDDLYMFDDFQVSSKPGARRPPCDNLYDVFSNIALDEGEHVRTMRACQDYAELGKLVVSPHAPGLTETVNGESSSDDLDFEKREQWKRWAEEINNDG